MGLEDGQWRGGEIQVENGKQKRDGMKLWEFAFEEKNFLLFDSVRVSRGLGRWPPPGRIHSTNLVYKNILLGIPTNIKGYKML